MVSAWTCRVSLLLDTLTRQEARAGSSAGSGWSWKVVFPVPLGAVLQRSLWQLHIESQNPWLVPLPQRPRFPADTVLSLHREGSAWSCGHSAQHGGQAEQAADGDSQ